MPYFDQQKAMSYPLFAIPSLALDFQPVKYEITSKVEMPGMPGTIPPQTITQCIAEQDPLPNQNPENQECKIVDMKQTDNTITWKMECDQRGQKITSTGSMTYKGDSFEGTILTNMGPQAGNMTMTTIITGKRLSDCQ
jgi:Protein of unknown function (DUF3617)